MRKKTYQQLQAIVHKTFVDLTDKIIIHTGNTYVIYNQYAVVRTPDCVTVYCRYQDKTITFGKMKHAVAWTILDHNNKMYEAERVRNLDQALDAIEVNKKIHDKLKKQGNIEQRIIYTNKLQMDIDRQRRFVSEIDKYIITADICHQRGIKNELNGTSRKQEKFDTTRIARTL